MKHTPGPWRSECGVATDRQFIYGSKNDLIAELANWLSVKNPGEVQAANARLIQAAPSLLEALQRIYNNASARRDNCRSDEESQVYNEIATEARLAIAKATGEKQ